MLTCLRVENFAIIETLELELGPGLNIVTGETGAGKSILIDALNLVLGARGRGDVVRGGADAAEVEALFDLASNPEVRERLEEAGLPSDEELLIRRIVSANGRTRAYINGRLSTQRELRALATGLTDISSQHEHHTLVNSANHLAYLDAFAGIENEVAMIGQAHAALREATARLEELQEAQRNRNDREDLLRFQLNEIESLSLQLGEDETLAERRQRLRHAESLAQVTGQAEEELYASDRALCAALSRMSAEVRRAAEMDPSLATLADRLAEAQAQLEDVASELGRYSRELVFDGAQLAEVDERLEEINRLKRKHGMTIAELLDYQRQALAELETLDAMEERLQDAEQERAARFDEAREIALSVRARRKEASQALGKQIGAELGSLGMGEAKVIVAVAALEGRAGEMSIDGARLSARGIDRAEFLIAPNRGEEAKPLQQVASGGELSRALLAIKRVLASVGPAGVYVFDEVDAGVGGAVAEVIGKKLREVAKHSQVVCITHLPQISVYGDRHFRVEKSLVGDRTVSRVRQLDADQRLEEIARMLGGMSITERTRAAAAEMIQGARPN